MTEQQQQLLPLSAGVSLQEARRKRRLSVATVATALRVPRDVIDSIEADELERFAPVYQRGYIKAYARYLGLDDDRTTALLDSISPDAPPLHTVFPTAPRRNPADRWLKASSYVLASLLIGTLAWQFTHEAVRLSQGEAQIPATEAAGTVGGERLDQDVAPATHANASIAALGSARQRASVGEQAWSALQQAAESADVMPAGEHILRLAASADSWVEIEDADGQQLELDLVRGGSEKAYQGVAPFRILLGRASAIELFLDGEAVDTAPFTSGDVTQMTLEAGPARSPLEGDGAD